METGFPQIRGHQKIRGILTRVIKNQRFAHAYVFSGPEGIGKRFTAIAFAKNLLCSSATGEGCEKCSSCIQVAGGHHPDLISVGPAKGIIPIESIRNLKRALSRKSFIGGYKVCIIDEADRMNAQAQNALLKTLEEPTPDTVFILVTNKPYRLLPTVLSRCQHLKFQPLAVSDASALIMEKMGVNQEKALLIASLTGGSPGRALEKKIEYFEGVRDSWVSRGQTFPRGATEQILNVVEDFWSDKEDLDFKLNLLRLWYRDLIMYKVYGNSAVLMNQDKGKEIAFQSSFFRLEKLLKIIFAIEEYSQNLEHNVNPQLTLETLFMHVNPESGISSGE